MNLKYYTGIVLLLLGLQSCKEDKEPDYKDDNTENGWIYSVMKSNYLWQEGIPEYSETKKTLSATDYFKSLLSDNEKKDDYYYSFIEEKTKSNDTKIASIDGLSYGFQFVLTKSEANSYYARILYVLPGSSAEKAGLKRGMWILKIDDNAVTTSNYKKLYSGGKVSLKVYTGHYSDTMESLSKTIELDAATYLLESPVFMATIMDVENKSVGYLSYNSFYTGPNGYNDKSWEKELIEAFNKFKSSAIDELILDLRYNGGGYLTTSQLLASMIAPQSARSQIYCRITYNEVRTPQYRDYKFLPDYAGMLDLQRVYILTGSYTASASEAVYNGLNGSGIIETIQVGSTTEGKNLGSEEFSDDRFNYILHPIVAKIMNKDGYGDYWNGFIPNQESLRFNELTNRRVLGELGTPEDYTIRLALQDMFPGYQVKASETKISADDEFITESELIHASFRRKNQSMSLIVK